MTVNRQWTIPQDVGDWVAEMSWTEGDTQAGPSMLTIRPRDPDNVPVGGLSSTVLRKIDFRAGAELLRDVRGFADDLMARVRETHKGLKPIDYVREALAEGITDDYLALLAIEYVGRVETGQPKPVDRIAEELGKSPGTIKGHLWQARNRQLLTGGSAGRKGGEVSEEARQLAMNWSMKHAAKPET